MIIADKIEDLNQIYEDISKDKRLEPLEMIKFGARIQFYYFKVNFNFHINGYKIFYAQMNDTKEEIKEIIKNYIKNINNYKYNDILKDDVNEIEKIAYYYEEDYKGYYLILNLDGNNALLFNELSINQTNKEIYDKSNK